MIKGISVANKLSHSSYCINMLLPSEFTSQNEIGDREKCFPREYHSYSFVDARYRLDLAHGAAGVLF